MDKAEREHKWSWWLEGSGTYRKCVFCGCIERFNCGSVKEATKMPTYFGNYCTP